MALGYFDPSTRLWGILLDSSTSYYRFYTFTYTGLNRIEGNEYLYLKTSTSLGTPEYFIGHRIKSGAALAGKSAPGTGKALAIGLDLDRIAADEAQFHAKFKRADAVATPLAVSDMARFLESALEEARNR